MTKVVPIPSDVAIAKATKLIAKRPSLHDEWPAAGIGDIGQSAMVQIDAFDTIQCKKPKIFPYLYTAR